MSVDGRYEISVKSPLGEQRSTLTIRSDGNSFAGTNVGTMGANEIAGCVEGSRLTWQEKMTVPMPMTLDITATVNEDEISGSVKAGAFGSFPMTGRRIA